ncbi:unnamed protein product, partial [Ectocarpus sp. 8 AP-2014]
PLAGESSEIDCDDRRGYAICYHNKFECAPRHEQTGCCCPQCCQGGANETGLSAPPRSSPNRLLIIVWTNRASAKSSCLLFCDRRVYVICSTHHVLGLCSFRAGLQVRAVS